MVRAQAWRVVAFSWAAQTARHGKMVALVERMLELNKRRGGLGPPAAGRRTGARRAPLPSELDREITSTDREIDELVYEFYGITQEERRIIEKE